MNNIFSKILHKPKVVVPVVIVIALIVGVVASTYIGRTPRIDLSIIASGDSISTAPTESDLNSFDLAFPKTGRVASISVAVGSTVKKGDVIASLEAADALGTVNQTKGALELAKAQYASLDLQYANVKKQQDVLVTNAYRTLLSSGLRPIASKKDSTNNLPIDNGQIPTITGTYSCDKEGSYKISPYYSGSQTGYSFTFDGIEKGSGDVTYYTPQPLGKCGLFITFPSGYSSSDFMTWVIDIPNIKSDSYVTNKNAYDAAVATRDQVLKQFEANLGQNGSSAANTAQAAISSAQGAYEAALGAYQNNLIIAPANGTVTFIDSHLKVGQSVTANKVVISISTK
jgi:multidrug efflux pump subunit AcrA (membrane-fusion protein)